MKILNLYAGIGGNRKLWGDEHEITAVELDDSIAAFYADQFPNDKVVAGDAHQYLLDHYSEFDFIWSSPPCPSHSRARFWASKPNKKVKPVYPDMKLYQEIILLDNYFSGRWVVENVNPFYTPLIKPSVKLGRHLFWSNFQIAAVPFYYEFKKDDIKHMENNLGYDTSGYSFNQPRNKVLRNCVEPEIGQHILNESQRVGMFTAEMLK